MLLFEFEVEFPLSELVLGGGVRGAQLPLSIGNILDILLVAGDLAEHNTNEHIDEEDRGERETNHNSDKGCTFQLLGLVVRVGGSRESVSLGSFARLKGTASLEVGGLKEELRGRSSCD